MSLRTPLGRVRGLGSAKEGVQHWWAQRVTAVALVPLVLWFVISLLSLVGADYAAVVEWMRRPFNTALLVVFLFTLFYHAKLGLQVVIEDYVHAEGVKMAALLATNFVIVLLGATGIVAVLRVAFGG
ncbi:MAG TPA: succinate dehydrogenase, hydrophobic membrane anchor protein [Candidatus Competibacteraceae bacterium]|nr:succinate dehydrogenase, hydrophobic membrane anchor protein [Candidatus Competibacteraceae bacterium]